MSPNFTNEEIVVYTKEEFNLHEYFFLIFSSIFILIMFVIILTYFINHCITSFCMIRKNQRNNQLKRVGHKRNLYCLQHFECRQEMMKMIKKKQFTYNLFCFRPLALLTILIWFSVIMITSRQDWFQSQSANTESPKLI